MCIRNLCTHTERERERERERETDTHTHTQTHKGRHVTYRPVPGGAVYTIVIVSLDPAEALI